MFKSRANIKFLISCLNATSFCPIFEVLPALDYLLLCHRWLTADAPALIAAASWGLVHDCSPPHSSIASNLLRLSSAFRFEAIWCKIPDLRRTKLKLTFMKIYKKEIGTFLVPWFCCRVPTSLAIWLVDPDLLWRNLTDSRLWSEGLLGKLCFRIFWKYTVEIYVILKSRLYPSFGKNIIVG